MKKLFCFAGVLVLMGSFAACGAKKAVVNEIPASAGIKILETIPNIPAPDWVNSSKDFWEEKGSYHYRGMSEGMTNIEAAKRAASASARVNIAEQVKNTVRNEFSRAMEAGSYDETTGGYLKDVFFSAVDNLNMSGAVISDSYSQRILETSKSDEKTYYRSYVLAQITVDDYKKMVTMAFTDTSVQVSANKSAKELAAETEARFWQAQEGK